MLKLTEHEARKQYTHLFVAALRANRKDKPNGVVSARVLFDGSNGKAMNRRTWIRDQESAGGRSPQTRDAGESEARRIDLRADRRRGGSTLADPNPPT